MPSRFTAELKVSRNLTEVRGFKMHLPNERVYNCLIECGNLFSVIGDNEIPAQSPDDRRLSEYRLILRPTLDIENEATIDAALAFESEDDGLNNGENQSESEIRDASDNSELENQIPADVSVSMGGLQLYPGAEGEAEETAVQEILFPQMVLELVNPVRGEETSGSIVSIHPQEAQDKLAVAMYPFLEVGYAADYWEAAERAAAVSKPLLAVVLWGALDDASC